MKTILSSLLLWSVAICATAQNNLIYTPPANDTAVLHANFLAIEKIYQDETSQLKGKENQSLLEFYRRRIDNIHSLFLQGEILADTVASKYLEKLTGQIISGNSMLQPLPLHFAISKSAVPNAASYGSGFIAFNAGLLTRLIQAADGNLFAVGEGYKRVVDAVGVGMNVLSRRVGGGNTMIKITDMVFMKFTPDFKVSGATIQEKSHNNFHTQAADFNSQHLIAQMIKMSGGFDYTFTTSNKDVSAFAFYYRDYERSKDFKGEVVHSIGYADNKVSTDRMELKSSASSVRVLPAKAGNVMILEYFRKDKTLNVHLEKMN